VPNKTTQQAREAIALFVDGNAHRLAEWLDEVANGIPEADIKPNPAKPLSYSKAWLSTMYPSWQGLRLLARMMGR
jgi:hypothetical protein